MIVEIEITEDLLKILPLFNFQHNEREYTRENYDDNGNCTEEVLTQHILLLDSENLMLGTDPIEDVAFALNIALQNEADMKGHRSYDPEVYNHLESLYNYAKEHLLYIESILHQYAAEGLKPGIYEAKDNELIWTKVN